MSTTGRRRFRRSLLMGVAAAGIAGLEAARHPAFGAIVRTDISKLPPYGNGTLPPAIRSRTVSGVNGLTMHVLESGFEVPGRPAVVLLHGFPELAYSWREVMLPLASAGFHVIAPDRRGYGRTTGWDGAYDVDLEPFSVLNRVRDVLALVSAFGYRHVAGVIGHDFGSPLAAWCSLIRPDVFGSIVMMSAPFPGPPALPSGTADQSRAVVSGTSTQTNLDDQLAALSRPRKYYMRYYATRDANRDMQSAPQGLHAFLRAYFHYKSADWKDNRPFPLKGRTADELAKLPTYYVMDLDKGMAETVAPQMPSPSQVAACRWLTEAELDVYTAEYARTGFQGGLDEYRCEFDANQTAELRLFAGRTIDVPSMFIGGRSDWGVYQTPGALEEMRDTVCRDFFGIHLIEGAGHWVQQEQPEKVNELLLHFLRQQGRQTHKS
jgi:pimeloyl-ACP methyl ester carboxylesterase